MNYGNRKIRLALIMALFFMLCLVSTIAVSEAHAEVPLRASRMPCIEKTEFSRLELLPAMKVEYAPLRSLISVSEKPAEDEEIEEVEEVVEVEITKNVYFDVPLSEGLQNHIFETCEKYDVDPALVVSIIWKESIFKANAVGDRGNSLGLMQIQPKWNYERMKKLGCPDLLDPYQNITVGVDILAEFIDTGKPIEWVLMRYNGGGGYANRKWAAGEVSDYAKTVLSNIDILEDGRDVRGEIQR